MSDTVSSTLTETLTATLSESFTASATVTAQATGNATTEETAQTFVSVSITTPLLYLGILIATLVVFSIYHRRSKIQSLQRLTSSSLFDSAYEITSDDVLRLATETPTTDSTPAIMYADLKGLDVHEKMLKCALIARAAESMRRIIKLKEVEPSILMLYTRGLIGDDSYKRYQMQSKLQDAEMMEVSKETEKMKAGWGRIIFANAQEVMMNQALRRRIAAVDQRKDIVEKLTYKGVETVIDGLQARINVLKQQ